MNLLSLIVLYVLFIKINADFEWMYHLPYGSDVVLKPLKKNPNERLTVKKCEWITPSRVRLRPGEPNPDFVRHLIDPTRCELKIFNIQKSTNGIYHCIINDTYITKAMLNYHGPPYASFFDEYKWNFVAGISTSACILVIFFIGSYVVKNRYREPIQTKKEEVQNEEINMDKVTTEVHLNEGFSNEEIKETNKQIDDVIISKF